MTPVERDENGRITGLSPLRERRLLQLAGQVFHHKAFYGQYRFLAGLTGWTIGYAYILPAGEERLAELLGQGV